MRKTGLIILLFSYLSLVGCEDQQQMNGEKNSLQVVSDSVLQRDALRYTRGLKLYQQTCAACHGKQGEGAANWQQKDADGKFLPPPLNGTGHTWHHPMYMLMDIIKNGTQRLGGNMPPWKGTLSDKQIQDILYWVQSQWPTEIYAAWYKNNQEVIRNRATAR